MTKILVTGVTGYIGGAVLTRLAKRDNFGSLDIRCIVRSPEKAAKLEALYKNVKTIADADDLDAATGTLQGLEKRFEETGKQPIFMNTDDANPEQIEMLNPSQPHRPVDLKIVAADAEDLYNPSRDYLGIAKGPLFDSGISNKKSIQIPVLINDRGQAGIIGLGKNIWNNVEIHDLADFYNFLFDAVLFCANEEHTWYQIGEAVSEVMLKINKGKGGAPTTFTEEELDKELDKYSMVRLSNLGGNSRCRAEPIDPMMGTEEYHARYACQRLC
ncbi:hypothetical protein BT96DRAFT_971153 [Gymnopus androsaceus JB14]|uniref:NAD(P)-binding protein n=1 Tax=Gymnopus androsaceus JB14 TaxID=1447944 RepID=A0A6A4IF98_9AGAR|nr:hypothetical protein BT96DRAFT_971153 [Gymnopus androsaceus JB14]